MNTFVVHAVPGSPYARAVLITLEEKGAAYSVAPVAPGTLRAPPHSERHPFGRVPVLDHGSFTLYETQAILRYLDRAVPEPRLTPADPKVAARMDQLMNINDWYLFQGVANVIVFQRLIRPRLMGQPADEGEIALALPRARTVLSELSKQLAAQDFFTGAKLSLADILIVPQLDFFSETPEWSELVAPHSNLTRWLERMRARPSLAATTRDRVVLKIQAG